MFGLMIHKIVENLRQADRQSSCSNLNACGINYMAVNAPVAYGDLL